MYLIGKLAILSLVCISISSTPIFASTPNDSIHFDDSDNVNFILKGTNTITNQENPSYKLNGIGDYMILESSLPEKLKEFSISVWVKPDFRVGAPATLSVVSASQTFDLSINNDQIEKNYATFSIYDGIKWHYVTSKSEIKDSWTHLAATFSDGTISIFVNGVNENSAKVDANYSFTYTHGKATQHSYDYLKSESKFLVGAFSPLLRVDGVVKNNFSGLIDDVLLYDIVIQPTKISKLYENDRSSYKPIIQAIESVQNKTGVANQYGFITNPDNPNGQKIEALSSEGYKIKKLSSGNNQPATSDNSIVDLINENTDADNQTSEILEDEKQTATTISVPITGSGNTAIMCHDPYGIAFTVTIFSSSVNLHLNHGDILGECVN